MSGLIHDHHDIRNESCPQNGTDIDKDCTCKAPVKRERKCDIINRKAVRERLLKMVNSNSVRQFTCVKPSTLDDLSSYLEAELRRRASDPPRTGKTL